MVLDDAPDLFPVSFAVEDSSIVFRFSSGTKLEALRHNPRVAFEVDGYDPERGTAWSVVLKGDAALIRNPDDLLDTISLEVSPWQAGPKSQFVRIVATEITGRSFRIQSPGGRTSPYDTAASTPQD